MRVRSGLAVMGFLVASAAGSPASASAEQLDFGEGRCVCTSIGVSAAGSMYVGDENGAGISVFSPNGELTRTITEGDGLSLTRLTDIQRLPDGNFLLARNFGDLQVMTPEGELVTSYSEYADQITVDAAGNVYWTWGRDVRRMAVGTGAVTTVFTNPSDGNWPLGGIAFNPVDGLLYVVDNNTQTHVIRRLTTAGESMGTFGSVGSFAGGVAIDGDGNVYVTGPESGVRKYSRGGAPLGFYAIGSSYNVEWHNGNLILMRWSAGVSKLELDDPIVTITGPASLRTAQRATFAATNSWLPFGSITRYEWDLDGNGSFETDTGSTATATRRFDSEGDRVVRVRVTSSRGTTDTGQVSMTVGRSQASLNAPAQVLTNQTFTLDASGSAQADSEITSVRFDRDGNGTFETDAGTSLRTDTFAAAIGAVNAGVQVTREGGIVDIARQTVSINLAPPPGPVGVSVNGGDKYTNDPNVLLAVVWPAFAQNALVANDGGFRTVRTFPVSATLPVTLDSSGLERLPKTVYARFDGSTQTLTDDIILDETRPPKISTALLALVPAKGSAATAKKRRSTKRRAYKVTLKATDKTSGVVRVQFARSKRKPSLPLKYARKVTVRGATAPKFVRAKDRAGNFSVWKKLKTKRR